MKRREFITMVGGAAALWPLAARAQQPAIPVVALINGGSAEADAREVVAFRKGLNESGYVEGQGDNSGHLANLGGLLFPRSIYGSTSWAGNQPTKD